MKNLFEIIANLELKINLNKKAVKELLQKIEIFLEVLRILQVEIFAPTRLCIEIKSKY